MGVQKPKRDTSCFGGRVSGLRNDVGRRRVGNSACKTERDKVHCHGRSGYLLLQGDVPKRVEISRRCKPKTDWYSYCVPARTRLMSHHHPPAACAPTTSYSDGIPRERALL